MAIGRRGDTHARPAGTAAGRGGRGARAGLPGAGARGGRLRPGRTRPGPGRPGRPGNGDRQRQDAGPGGGAEQRDRRAGHRPGGVLRRRRRVAAGQAPRPGPSAARPAGSGVRQLRDPGRLRRDDPSPAGRAGRGEPRGSAPLPDGHGALVHLPGPASGAGRRDRAGGRDHPGQPERGLGPGAAGGEAAPDRARGPAAGARGVARVLALCPRVAGEGRLAAVDAGASPGAGREPARRGAGVRPALVRLRLPAAAAGGLPVGVAGRAPELA